MKTLCTHTIAVLAGAVMAICYSILTKEHNSGTLQAIGHSISQKGATRMPRDPVIHDPVIHDPIIENQASYNLKQALENIEQISVADLEPWLLKMQQHPDAYGAAQVIAGIITNNTDLVRAGIHSDPQNPHLLCVGATHKGFSEEYRQDLSRIFLELDPENSLAAYIHSANLFEAGEIEQGVQTLKSSESRFDYNDYSKDTVLLMEDAYIGSGLDLQTARLGSTYGLPLPHLFSMGNLIKSIHGMQESMSEEDASELRSLSAMMGMRITNETQPGSFMTHLVGLNLEEKTLEGLETGSLSHYDGLTVGEALQEIGEERKELLEITQRTPELEMVFENNHELQTKYIDRVRYVGEVDAMKWLLREIEQ